MSETLGRFVSMAAPDVFEVGAKAWLNPSDRPPRARKPRLSASGLAPKEISPVSKSNPTPEEIQASLHGELVKYVDARPTPESKAEALIKIGQYQMELSKYAPVLRDADEDMVEEVIGGWLDAGDAELKKAVFNASAGSEELPLRKSVDDENAPDQRLAKMVDEAGDDRQRKMQIVQHIGTYGAQLRTMLNKMDEIGLPDEDREKVMVDWVGSGDGRHKMLKQALVDQETLSKVTEKEVVNEHPGNASSHVGRVFGGMKDAKASATVPQRSTSPGAGPRMRGTEAAPGQAGQDDKTNVSSGGDDQGSAGMTPEHHIKRKGTTGGLGSTHGTGTVDVDPNKKGGTNKKLMMPAYMKKSVDSTDAEGELSAALIKIAPEAMIAAISELETDDQVAVCKVAAQDAADLMAWSAQQGDGLQKSALDAAVADWLGSDPNAIQLKKWVAEALATAEEIPLALGKAIMNWEPPAPARQLRLRQPHAVAAE